MVSSQTVVSSPAVPVWYPVATRTLGSRARQRGQFFGLLQTSPGRSALRRARTVSRRSSCSPAGCPAGRLAGDILDEPVDDEAAARAPGQRVTGQDANRVIECNRVDRDSGQGFRQLAMVTGEQVQGYRFWAELRA